jgi:hypothetical protein
MDFTEFKIQIQGAFTAGMFIKPHHDPNLLGINIYDFKRSVISREIRNSFLEYSASEKYCVYEYNNSTRGYSKYYYVIDPYPNSLFTPPSSGGY